MTAAAAGAAGEVEPTARLVSLEESGLGVTAEEIWKLFEPFCERGVAEDDPRWLHEVARRRRKIRKRLFRRRFLPLLSRARRSKQVVLDEYGPGWEASDDAWYDPSRKPPRITPWVWRGENLFASDIGATRFRQLFLVRLVERLKPRRILEIGSGNGINLLLLAGRFPEIELHGAELTRQGVRKARHLQSRGVLPPHLQAFSPEPVRDPTAFTRVTFTQADAGRLPFTSGAFDLVYTFLALEQMESLRHRALSELSRVTSSHALMIEPFRDANASSWPRKNILARDYFQGSLADLPHHGLHPLLATTDFPQELFLKSCLVLAERDDRRPRRRPLP